MSEDFGLATGLRVETFDHRSLGTVRAVDAERILLRPRLGAPFWLPQGLVRTVDGERATLHINSSVVGRYRQPIEGAAARSSQVRRRLLASTLACGAALAVLAIAPWSSV